MSVMTVTDNGAPPPPERGPGQRRPWVIVAAMAVVAILIAVAVSWTHAPWRDFVHRKPASYVELTVVDVAALPSTFVAGEPVSFRFAIHNVDRAGTRRVIRWETSVRDAVTGAVTPAGRSSAVVEAGAVRTVAERVTIDGRNRSEVIVKLDSGQQIDFYVTPASPR